jgi:hypothetical protein
MPVNAALNTALENLLRCESMARNIRAQIHGEQPSPTEGHEKPQHQQASQASNTLASRLSTLGDLLVEISDSF